MSAAVDEVLSRDVPHATGKESLRNKLLHRAYEVHERAAEVPALKANFVAAARTDPSLRGLLDRIWPTLSAPTVVHRLLTNRSVRRRAAGGLFDHAETELLGRALPRRLAEVRWKGTEIPLLDEAEARLRGVRSTYGHIIVDEAQDLSAMALRMLARRADGGSMTVVGDLAQATRPWAQRSWDTVVDVLRGAAPGEFAELTVGYRTPAPVLDLANRLLATAAPGVTPARSIRRTGQDPAACRRPGRTRRRGGRGDGGAVRRTGDGRDRRRGRPPPGAAGRARPERRRVGSGPDALGSVTLLTPLLAKGLEFDAVIVVEPAEIVASEPAGLRALFVALTRPTRSLTVVHARPLPGELDTAVRAGR